MKHILSLLIVLLVSAQGFAQFKQAAPSQKKINTDNLKINKINKVVKPSNDHEGFRYHESINFKNRDQRNVAQSAVSLNRTNNEFGVPQLIEVHTQVKKSNFARADFYQLLESQREVLQQTEIVQSFRPINEKMEDIGQYHVKANQYANDVRVYDGQISTHFYQDGKRLIMGRVIPAEMFEGLAHQASTTKDQAFETIQSNFTHYQTVEWFEKDFNQWSAELVYYNHHDHYHLAWYVDVYENLADRHNYFVDAVSGEILNTYGTICKFHDHGNLAPPDGPTTATNQDLLGINRTINTYEVGSTFFMLDASRSMFNAGASELPDDPVGGILTLDAKNTAPQNSDFQVEHVTSSNNNWGNNPTGVSAHYNAGQSYEYFRNTHNRNSINGEGGSVYSLINVANENGSSMGNAFWNGIAMFYGNGDSAFFPLARALDVAGHEISHGVVQNTANLEYQGESGAMNESFADIFGAMIDRDDWKIGEDVAKSNVFPGGALRDMQDPHNNASTNDYGSGWQPKHVNEQFTGSQDNGGVHINSGIPNHAFYLFATEINKDRAEKVFYRALDVYLTKSSRFVDLRNAVVQAADDLYGTAEVDAAKNAFSAVGIGEGSGTTTQEDAGVNPGDDLIAFFNLAKDELNIVDETVNTTFLGNPVVSGGLLSRISVTDDGSEMVVIGQDRLMYYITVNWDSGDVNVSVLSSDPIWRNVVISKDGEHIAALFDDETPRIWVYNFASQNQREYELYNPTFSEGVSTGDVLFADAMEFDITGQYVVYDASNEIPSGTGVSIEYWDIGFLHCWDRSTNNFTSNTNNNYISKLFSALPEGVSAGNPTFAKNSPFIVAFDLLEGNNYDLLGANLETGDIGTLYQNTGLSWPNYSRTDNQIIYNLSTLFGDDIGITNVNGDKISPVPNSDDFLIIGAQLGVWFANGDRNLYVNTDDVALVESNISLFPNPASTLLNIEVKEGSFDNYSVYDLKGAILQSGNLQNNRVDISDLPSGQYMIKLANPLNWTIKSFVKE